jgi:DHA1 family inner membrane transport protein
MAGLVIAGFGLGGVVYSLAIPALIAWIAERRLMVVGGALAAAAMVLAAAPFPWYALAGIFFILGFGFYLLHGSIQVHVTELSQTARGVAASLHSCFFYLGQAAGPMVYSVGFAHDEGTATILAGAVVVMAVGFICARLLRHRTASH